LQTNKKLKINMKKTERKAIEEKLLTGIQKIIKANKVALTNKTEKAIKKIFKQVAKKQNKTKIGISKV